MKILIALTRFPWPTDKGDKLRAFYQIRGLADKHEVHLISLNEEQPSREALKALEPYCKSITVFTLPLWKRLLNLSLSLFNRYPYQVNYFRSARMKRAIRKIVKENGIDLCYVQLIRLGLNIPFEVGCRFFLDYMDAFSIGMENRIPLSGTFSRPFVRQEAKRLKWYEGAAAGKFDGLSIISAQDANALPPVVREDTLILPNGVGERFFKPIPDGTRQDFDLIFTGNMGYHPNVQSALYIGERILPELEKLGLKPRLCIAGARPAPAVKALANTQVEVTGYVDDMRDWLCRSKIAVAPLISGQGLQNKLLEAMAMGIPTLTTPLANAALGAPAGKAIVVCETPEDFASEIRRLLESPEEAHRLGAEGRRFVQEQYDWAAMNQKLETAFLKVMAENS